MARSENKYEIDGVTYVVSPLQNQEVDKMKAGKAKNAFIKNVAYKSHTPEKPEVEEGPSAGAASQGPVSSEKLGG